MARNASKPFLMLLLFLTTGGLLYLLFAYLSKRNQSTAGNLPSPGKTSPDLLTGKAGAAIRNALAGYPEQTIRNWIAISAHETGGWTSRIYREANNLFGMTLASKNTTAIGRGPYSEGQAMFASIDDSAKDIRLYMEKRFSYPRQFPTLLDQILYMKSKGYFTDSVDNYFTAVEKWKRKFYGDDNASSALTKSGFDITKFGYQG